MTEAPRSAGARDLVALAQAARSTAYAPYSSYRVGAAVETDAGIFTGCNIENASYSLAVCAERVAVMTAIAAGARTCHRLAVSAGAPVRGSRVFRLTPCGACLQTLSEFMGPSGSVVIDGVGEYEFGDLFPHPFQSVGKP